MSALTLAAVDAAKNCAEYDASAIVTLRSGVEIEGELERSSDDLYREGATLHLRLGDGGWATVLFSEVAAIRTKPGWRSRR